MSQDSTENCLKTSVSSEKGKAWTFDEFVAVANEETDMSRIEKQSKNVHQSVDGSPCSKSTDSQIQTSHSDVKILNGGTFENRIAALKAMTRMKLVDAVRFFKIKSNTIEEKSDFISDPITSEEKPIMENANSANLFRPASKKMWLRPNALESKISALKVMTSRKLADVVKVPKNFGPNSREEKHAVANCNFSLPAEPGAGSVGNADKLRKKPAETVHPSGTIQLDTSGGLSIDKLGAEIDTSGRSEMERSGQVQVEISTFPWMQTMGLFVAGTNFYWAALILMSNHIALLNLVTSVMIGSLMMIAIAIENEDYALTATAFHFPRITCALSSLSTNAYALYKLGPRSYDRWPKIVAFLCASEESFHRWNLDPLSNFVINVVFAAVAYKLHELILEGKNQQRNSFHKHKATSVSQETMTE